MKKCLAIIGDHWHKAGVYKKMLTGVCEQALLTTDFIEDHGRIPWESIDNYEVIILSKEGRIEPEISDRVWYTDEHGKTLEAWVQRGGGLFVLHSGLASYSRESRFHSIMKGGFLFHPEEHPPYLVESRQEAPAEFSGMQFHARDELYVVYVNSAETEILMDSSSPDYGIFPAAWRHGLGNGKVFCLTPGHNEEVLKDTGYLKVISLGLSWLQ